MTELEHHLIVSLEKLEMGLIDKLDATTSVILALENRIADLEQHAPLLARLCNELDNTLQRLNANIPAKRENQNQQTCHDKTRKENIMQNKDKKDDSWERFNLGLKLGLKNCELYPKRTTFLAELSTAMRSASGNGRIEWDVMEQIDEKLIECMKALGDPVFTSPLT